MAHAVELPGANPVLEAHPELSFKMGAYTWTVETRNSQSVYKVTDGTGSLSLPIHWSFGAQAQTWVFEQDGKFYESIVSFYPAANNLGITTGDEQITPQILQEAMGRELTPMDTKLCFGCHASNAVNSGKLALDHPPRRRHLRALSSGSARSRNRRRQRRLQHHTSAPSGHDLRIRLQLLRPMSSFLGNCRTQWLARLARCPLPALPPRQQPLLQRNRSAHQLHRLPRSPQGSRPLRRFLRFKVPRMPCCLGKTYEHRQSKNMPNGDL